MGLLSLGKGGLQNYIQPYKENKPDIINLRKQFSIIALERYNPLFPTSSAPLLPSDHL